MAPPRRHESSATSVRLRAIRRVKGFATAKQMADTLGVHLGRYLSHESTRPLSKEMAIAIVNKIPGLTLDYLFLGRTDGMPGVLARDLQAAEDEILTSR
jgi:hypothetical protein